METYKNDEVKNFTSTNFEILNANNSVDLSSVSLYKTTLTCKINSQNHTNEINVLWNYEDQNSMKNFPNWNHCQTSPTNIFTSLVSTSQKSLNTSYYNSEGEYHDDGTTVKFYLENLTTNYAQFSGVNYNLIQFHYHCPTEHTIDNVKHDLELHLVHKEKTSGNHQPFFVIGFLFRLNSTSSPFIHEYAQQIQNLTIKKKNNKHINLLYSECDHKVCDKNNLDTIDISSVFKLNDSTTIPNDFWYQLGSLTTPPFDPIVQWVLMKTIMNISQEDLNIFKSFYSNNARIPDQGGFYRVLQTGHPLCCYSSN